MRHIATDVAWSVCVLITTVSRKKTDESIEIAFELWTRVRPRNHYWGSGSLKTRGSWEGVVPPFECIKLCKQQTPQQKGFADLSAGDSTPRRKRSEWTHPPQADKCGGDAAFRQNSLTTCYIYDTSLMWLVVSFCTFSMRVKFSYSLAFSAKRKAFN